MTDPLRAEIERLAREWEQEAGRRRKDAARPGEPPSSRRALECGAAFELTHAAALRAALRSTSPASPEPEGGARAWARRWKLSAKRHGWSSTRADGTPRLKPSPSLSPATDPEVTDG